MTTLDKIPLGLAILALALAVLGSGLLSISLLKNWQAMHARGTLDEFQKLFPGRCPICSFHDYGVREGHTPPGPPPEHNCLEKK